MEIQSGDLNEDIRDLVVEIVKTLPWELQNNLTANRIREVLNKHIQTVNIVVTHTDEELNYIKEIEHYTEHKIHHGLVKALLESPSLYETIRIETFTRHSPLMERKFTLPILKVKK